MTTYPMLADTVPEEWLRSRPAAVGYFDDPEVWLQEKVDGQRYLAAVESGVVNVTGRNGQPKVSQRSHAVDAALALAFPRGRIVLDGEMVAGRYLVFDIVDGTGIGTLTPFADRYAALSAVFAAWSPDPALIVLLPVARTAAEKRALVASITAARGEGVIIRTTTGLYTPGVRSLGRIKYTKDVDVIVTAVNVVGVGGQVRHNAQLELIDADSNRVIVGRASTNGKGLVAPGQVWTVRFLKFTADGRMYQPRLLRLRSEKAAMDCSLSQLGDARLITERA